MNFPSQDPELAPADAAAAIRTIVLLYEAAVDAIESAAAAVEAGDIVGRCRGVERAFGIVAHLYGCLDRERGGEVAENLARSYRLVLARLVLVGPRNDAGPARDAVRLLSPLLQAWQQLETAGPLDGAGEAAAAANAAYSRPAAAA